MIQLNNQQQQTLQSLHEFYNSEDEQLFLVSGYAGTGKTFTIQHFILQLLDENPKLKVALTAPTNKAVKVLKGMASEWDIRADFLTTHQLLGLTMSVDTNTGNEIAVIKDRKRNKPTVHLYDLVIIDESSMINKDLWTKFNHQIKGRKAKVVLMGDSAQLPPVNEELSPVFTAGLATCQLTEVMRQKGGNPVGLLVDATRQAVTDSEQFFEPTDLMDDIAYKFDKSEGVWWLGQSEWMTQMVRAFKSPTYRNNSDHARVLAWTNQRVNELNEFIRSELYGTRAREQFVIGERLIADKPIFYYENLIFPTSTEFEVKEVKIGRIKPLDNEYRAYKLKVVTEDDRTYPCNIVHPDDYQRYLDDLEVQRLRSIENNTWSHYYLLKNCSAQVSYSYALTCHKSQGSTFNNVFVSLGDILRNKNVHERHKCLYVAFSRASQRLLINC